MQITVSAPGKIILAGEHAVVYNHPALLITIDKRDSVTLRANTDEYKKLNIKNKKYISKIKKKITLTDKLLNVREEVTLEEVLEFTEKARERWDEFGKTGEVRILKELMKEPLGLVKVAIGETILYWQQATSNKQKITGNKLARHKAQVIENFELEIESEIPIGRGMGSSAAIATAIIGAVYLYLKNKTFFLRQVQDQDDKFNKEDLGIIYKIALEAEKRVHGNPSGGDTAAVVYGGTIWFKKNPDGSRTITPLQFPKEVYADFTLIDSGKPLETTGEMVGEVRKKIKVRLRWGKEIFSEMEEATNSMKEGLENKNKVQIAQAINRSERCLEKIGVVSDATREIIRKLKDFGIAAKVSGAGGKKRSSGMVLCYGEGAKVRELAQKLGVEVLAGEFGGEGIICNMID